jgi:hypothetical protein
MSKEWFQTFLDIFLTFINYLILFKRDYVLYPQSVGAEFFKCIDGFCDIFIMILLLQVGYFTSFVFDKGSLQLFHKFFLEIVNSILYLLTNITHF